MTSDPVRHPAAADLSRLHIRRDESPRRRWVPWLILALLALATAAAYPRARAYLAARRAPEIEIAHAVSLTVSSTGELPASPVLAASGYVVARRSAEVGGKVGGRLSYVGVEEGDRVRAQQVIARIEHADLIAQLAAAETAVEEADALIMQAVATRDEDARALQRQLALKRDGIATEAAVTGAEAAAAVSQARVRSSEAALASARARVRVTEESIENTNIRAPFDGVVIAKRAEVGETVSPFGVAGEATREGGAIATIADLRELEVQTEVSENGIAKLTPRMSAVVKLQAYPDVTYTGRLRQVFPAANRAKAIVEVRVTIVDADERVKPEMTATVTFQEQPRAVPAVQGTTRQSQIVLIPRRAVAQRAGRPHAWVVHEGRAALRALTLGPERLDEIEVTSGVLPGEAVILNPPPELADGAMVRVRTGT